MSGYKGDEALAEYKKAFAVMTEKKAASKRAAPIDDDEFQFIRSSKRQATGAATSSSSKKKSLTPDPSPEVTAAYDWSNVLSNLSTKVFTSTLVLLASEEDPIVAIRSLQGDLLQLPHFGKKNEDKASMKAEVDALTSQLYEEKNSFLAKEKEIKGLKLKLRNSEEARDLAATENVSLKSQMESREEDLIELQSAAESFEVKKAMAVNGAKVETRWELMRDWLNKRTDNWDLKRTLEQYKVVKTDEAELSGLPVPSFEDEPQIPDVVEGEQVPESTADDPLAN